MVRYDYLWKINLTNSGIPSELLDDFYGISIPTTDRDIALEHLAHKVKSEDKSLISYLAAKLKKEANEGKVNIQRLGRIGPTESRPMRLRKARKQLPSYEGMREVVREGLYHERRNSPNYSEVNDVKLRELTNRFVDNLPKHQLVGIYFRRFNPDARKPKEQKPEKYRQPALF